MSFVVKTRLVAPMKARPHWVDDYGRNPMRLGRPLAFGRAENGGDRSIGGPGRIDRKSVV